MCKFIYKSKVYIFKIETGMSVTSVCEKHGVKKQTVFDMKKKQS